MDDGSIRPDQSQVGSVTAEIQATSLAERSCKTRHDPTLLLVLIIPVSGEDSKSCSCRLRLFPTERVKRNPNRRRDPHFAETSPVVPPRVKPNAAHLNRMILDRKELNAIQVTRKPVPLTVDCDGLLKSMIIAETRFPQDAHAAVNLLDQPPIAKLLIHRKPVIIVSILVSEDDANSVDGVRPQPSRKAVISPPHVASNSISPPLLGDCAINRSGVIITGLPQHAVDHFPV